MAKEAKKFTVKGFFKGRPDSYGLFLRTKSLMNTLGPVKVSVSKTHISFGAKRKFAWVWLPQQWIEDRPQKSITLTFDNCRRIVSKKLESSVEPYPGRWTHHVLIASSDDLDDEIRLWLGEAYLLGGGVDFLKDTNSLKWRGKTRRAVLQSGNEPGYGSTGEYYV